MFQQNVSSVDQNYMDFSLLRDCCVHSKRWPCEWTGLTSHFECLEFSFRSDSQEIGISSILFNALEYVIVRPPSLSTQDASFVDEKFLSVERHKVLTRITLHRIHFHRKFVSMHSTRNTLSSRLCTTVQNPTTASEPPPATKKKTICGRGSLTYLSTKSVCFIHISDSRFRFNHFTSEMSTNATQKKCTKINRRRHGHEARIHIIRASRCEDKDENSKHKWIFPFPAPSCNGQHHHHPRCRWRWMRRRRLRE